MSTLPKIFGLPPGSPMSNPLINASMPLATITPCLPKFSKGMNIFTLKNAWSSGNPPTHPSYTELLGELGFSIPGDKITVAFLADSFPTDTFSNEYGASFLESLTSMSNGIGDIAQMFGSGSLEGIAANMGKAATDMGKDAGGILETVMNTVGAGFNKAGAGMKKVNALANKHAGTFTGSMLKTVSQMMAGARVDFPQVWKNSGFQPSYTMTIRLYNPNPGDVSSTEQYIIGPIAALVLLAVPISQDGNVYNWPYLHKIKSPGIYNLDPAFISNVTVVKGGDQQQIAYNQQLGIVDVRIDFGSLYNSMIATKGGVAPNRPTLKTYIKALREGKLVAKDIIDSPLEVADVFNNATPVKKYANTTTSGSNIVLAENRVNSSKELTAEELAGDMPSMIG